MEPSTWQDSTATPPAGELTFTAGLRTGEGSVLVATQAKHQSAVISGEQTEQK